MFGDRKRKKTDMWRFETAQYITMHVYRGNNSSRFSRNSEANASELLENLEEMFPRNW